MRSLPFLCILCLLFFSFTNVHAQDFNAFIKEADRLEAIPNEKGALHEFKEALKLQPLNLYALTKCSELCSRIAGREQNEQSKDSYNQAAIIYARTAIKLYPNSDEANVAIAIAVGRTMLKKSGKEKLAIAREIKQYADIAVKANPNNFKAWHVLGKWNYEISNLSAFERGIAKIFLGGVPQGSLKNSIAAYEKARTLNPNFALNYLELARAYHKDNSVTKAISLLKIVLTLPIQTEDDPRIKKDAQRLLKEWS
jgi:tetratricopeptide (TPR) repeat protein